MGGKRFVTLQTKTFDRNGVGWLRWLHQKQLWQLIFRLVYGIRSIQAVLSYLLLLE